MLVYFSIGFLFSLVIDILSINRLDDALKITTSERVLWVCLWPYFLIIFLKAYFSK